jgi:hypothetical protein
MRDRFATHQLAGSAVASVWAVGFLDPHFWYQSWLRSCGHYRADEELGSMRIGDNVIV